MMQDLRAKLEAIVSEAKAAGRMADLLAAWSELVPAPGADAASADRVMDATSIPGRFGMVGDSAPMRALHELVAKVGPRTSRRW